MVIERNGVKITLTKTEIQQAYLEKNQETYKDKLMLYLTPYQKTEKLNISEWDSVRKMTMQKYRHMETDEISEAQKWVSCIENSIMIVKSFRPAQT